MLIFCSVLGENPSRPLRKNLVIDEGLFEKIGDGDPIAFEELYRLTEKTVYAYLLSILKNHDMVQDVMQDTYLKIRSAAHLYKPQGKPLAWIFTVARNLALMKIRTNKRYVNTEFSYMENDINFSYLTDDDDKFVLQMALKILNEQERKVILLHAVSGLKHREIASNLSIPLSTVLSQYHRGLRKLRKHLSERGGYNNEP
ncbi:MAG TPA: RNA polymerase sigma factor [Clostridiales bacterium]|jgi:RNA polymerase sigma-70 factor (ECF subfamily)|nr:RNA polymerase sigma factor [Clostridiales bacterium]HBT17982.1 RNA polymerase sigma factor [Bacillota bacterium]